MSSATAPADLQSLINLVYERAGDDVEARYGTLVAVLKEHHYWPALQVKHFFDRSGLTLLHNTYTRSDVEHFQALYDECRSVVLDLSQPADANIVVSLASAIPVRMTDVQYREAAETAEDAAQAGAAEADSQADVIERSYDGTVISVYHHKDVWHFGTSTCPVIDRSRFAHPTKSHGAMMDEALAKMMGESDEAEPADNEAEPVRAKLTAALDPTNVYTFILTHHENVRAPLPAMVREYGEDYAFLVHIGTRRRDTLEALDLGYRPLQALGLVYPTRFATAADGLAWMAENAGCGLIVKRGKGLIKVMTSASLEAETMDLGNANPWVNMLWVYMQNKPHYKINDYIERYLPAFEPPIAPTYAIHTVICTMRDILLSLYQATTVYYTDHKRFKMDKQIDSTFPPIIRFHLAQLRHIQVTRHTHAAINGRTVYHYLCLHSTLKNVRGLIRHFAEQVAAGYHGLPTRTADCFVRLNALLAE